MTHAEVRIHLLMKEKAVWLGSFPPRKHPSNRMQIQGLAARSLLCMYPPARLLTFLTDIAVSTYIRPHSDHVDH